MRPLFWLLAILALIILFGMGLLVFALVALSVLIVANWWLCRYWAQHLVVTRSVSRAEAEIGHVVEVTLDISNTGRLPLLWAVLEDLLSRHALLPPPARLEVQGRRIAMVSLPAGGKLRLIYGLKAAGRGFFQIGPTLVELGDLFGLFRRFRVLTEPQFLTVYPPLLPIEGYDVASRRPIGEIRLTHRLYEDPTRIAGVREYRAGDSLRQIHWRASARTARLQSKIYEPSVIAGATLVMDFHRSSYPDRGRAELAITCAASLAAAICAQRQQVGLVTNGRDAAERIRTEGWEIEYPTLEMARQATQMRPQSSRLAPIVVRTAKADTQLPQILEVLARLELSDGLPIGQALLETVAYLPRDATVLAILPAAEESALGALIGLREEGMAVSVIVNTYEAHDYAVAAERFLTHGIEARHLRDQLSITQLCQPYVLP
jgi:uncharacterized protein (DUF58 family)